jgi:hypothetical protein
MEDLILIAKQFEPSIKIGRGALAEHLRLGWQIVDETGSIIPQPKPVLPTVNFTVPKQVRLA